MWFLLQTRTNTEHFVYKSNQKYKNITVTSIPT